MRIYQKLILIVFALFISLHATSFAYTANDTLSIPEKVAYVLDRTADTTVIALSADFDQIWSSPILNATSKANLEFILDFFYTNNYKARPYYTKLIEGLKGAQENHQLSASEMDKYLGFVKYYIEIEEFAKLRSFLIQTANLLDKNALYYSNYYKLIFQSGSLSFDEIMEVALQETPPAEEEEDLYDDWSDESDDWSSDDDWESTDDWGDDWGNNDAWGNDAQSDDWNNNMEEDEFFAREEQKVENISFTEPRPVLSGPVAKLQNVDLLFITPFDSVWIPNVSGSIALPGSVFLAEGGTLDWKMAGWPEGSITAKLDLYHFDVNKPYFEADKVKLSYPDLFDQEINGLLEFKLEARANEKARYPRFISLKSDLNYEKLRKKNIFLKGGFSIEGRKISTQSLLGRGSSLRLQNEVGDIFSSRSLYYDLADSMLVAHQSTATIYHRRDSIFHPGLNMRFDLKTDRLTLHRKDGDYKRAPFLSTYFNIYITADIIKWDTKADSLDISILNARDRNPAIFESVEYFDEVRLYSLSESLNFSPLSFVINHYNKFGTDRFYVDEMIDALPKQVKKKINANSIRSSMQLLMQTGFILYDKFSGEIRLQELAHHYYLSNLGKKDYDNMSIESVTRHHSNATLNLAKQTMTIRGVDEFDLNKKLGVSIKPKDSEIILKRNRDVEFDGVVLAGNYEYVGEEFVLDYDSFLIDMPNIERIKFNLEQKGKRNRQGGERKTLENSLVETAGVLYINKPDNKAALKDYPNYPLFNATQGATVYFLGEEILGGVYDQSLYFVIPPFEIDSVASSDPSTIAFDGTFHSGGIFPEFEEKLRVMPDNSLGFEHPLPEEGMDIYDGKAKIYGSLILNNKGLQGKDKIEYLSTVLYAPSFIFFKDSLSANGTLGFIEGGDYEGTSFPDVEFERYQLKWLPLKDSMYISNVDQPFEIYQQTATLSGRLNVSKTGLFGSGEMKTRGSIINSSRYRFRESDISARYADFIVESDDPEKPALQGDEVRLLFNLNEGIADISPEVEGRAAINFPYAQYKTSIPTAKWNLAEHSISMKKPANVDIESSYFYATREDQDSLVFNATEAFYDIDMLQLKVSGIPYIISADAKIIPENNEALILANAEIQDFYNAELILDTLNEYHDLIDGNIKILSRKKFEGNAIYRYVNSMNDTFNITMGDFELRPYTESSKAGKARTVSTGIVDANDWLLISPGMYFKGEATMFADKPALSLKGYIKLDLKNIPNYDTWIAFESSGDEKQIIFDFDNSITEMGEKLTAGLHFESGINDLYATFISDKRSIVDEDFFLPSGLLYYNQERNEYIIEDSKKMEGESLSGKVFSYNEQTSDVSFEGPLSFIELPEKSDVNIISSGSGQGNLDRAEFSFNTFMIFNFSLPRQAVQLMGQDALEVVERLGAAEANKDFSLLMSKLAEIVGDNAAKAYQERSYQEYVPLYTIGRDLVSDVVLSNVDLKWSEGNSAWYSNGKIGLSNFGPFDINAAVDGFIEIRKSFEGEIITLFLQISPSAWYYFKYENNQLLFYSASEDINRAVQSKSKAGKAKAGKYIFETADIQVVRDFVTEFRSIYYNINAPYFLEMAGSESYQAPANIQQNEGWGTDKEEDEDDGF